MSTFFGSTSKSISPDDNMRLEAIFERLIDQQRRGEKVDIQAEAAEHPTLATMIVQLWGMVEFLEKSGGLRKESTGARQAFSGAPTIPDYHIVREIGRGGMGIVYEAIQTRLGRNVALKILPPGRIQNSQALERFRRESKSAAALHHTNIVPVFEAGEFEGILFYSMQLIDGQGLDIVRERIRELRSRAAESTRKSGKGKRTTQAVTLGVETTLPSQSLDVQPEIDADFNLDRTEPIGIGSATTEKTSDHVRKVRSDPPMSTGEARRSTELWDNGSGVEHYRFVARVGIQIARALQHAHDRGVIHRDVKPSNVILDRDGTLWLADFGLAKQEGTDLTGTTEAPGTLRYMAPERFSGESSFSSDQYSLGVSLYELLTLQPAFTGSDPYALMEEIRLGKLVSPRSRDSDIPLDLETIILKSAAKYPADRYDSVGAMADDLGRFLEGRPILARPVSVPERLIRWARRNPALATSLTTLLLFLVTVSIISTRAAFAFRELAASESLNRQKADLATRTAETAADRERAARVEEQQQRMIAETVRDFVNKDILALTSVDGQLRFNDFNSITLSRKTTLEELLQRAAEKLKAREDLDLRTRSELAWIIGINLRVQGRLTEGVELLRESAEGFRQLEGLDGERTLLSEQSLAVALRYLGQYSEALEIVDSVIDRLSLKYGTKSAATLSIRVNREIMRLESGRIDNANEAIAELIKDFSEQPDSEVEYLFLAKLHQITALSATGRSEEAIERCIVLKTDSAQLFQEEPSRVLQVEREWIRLLANSERAAEAVPLARDLWMKLVEVRGASDPIVLGTAIEYANSLRRSGDPDKALELVQEKIADLSDVLGRDHPSTLQAQVIFAECYRDVGQYSQALIILEDTTKRLTHRYGERFPATLRARNNQAEILKRMGNFRAAVELGRATLKLMQEVLGARHHDTLTCMNNLGLALGGAGDFDAATDILTEAVAMEESTRSVAGRAVTLNNLAGIYLDKNELEQAVSTWQTALDLLEPSVGKDHKVTLACLNGLATAYERMRRLDLAIPLWEQIVESYQSNYSAAHRDALIARNNLAFGYLSSGSPDRAVEILEPLMKVVSEVFGSEHDQYFSTAGNLASALFDLKKFDRAFEIWREVVPRCRKVKGDVHPRTLIMWRSYGVALYQNSRFADAIEVFKELQQTCIESFGPQHFESLRMSGNLGINYLEHGEVEKSIELLEPVFRASLKNSRLSFVRKPLLRASAKLGKATLADEVGNAIVEQLRVQHRGNPEALAEGLIDIAKLATQASNKESALALGNEAHHALQTLEDSGTLSTKWLLFYSKSVLAILELANGDAIRAGELITAARSGLKQNFASIPRAVRIERMKECLEGGVKIWRELERDDLFVLWENELDGLRDEASEAEHSESAGTDSPNER